MDWLTGSEIYPLAVRGAGTSAQAATLWSTNLLITLTRSLEQIEGRLREGRFRPQDFERVRSEPATLGRAATTG